jgi:HEAT repeats/PBS lyase HEAT-like repeat
VTLTVVAWSALALTALSIAFVLLLALRRFALAREARRHLAAEKRLEPVALALASGEPVVPIGLGVEDAEVVAALLGRYVRQLRGQARADIAGFFEERGFVEREIAELHNRRTWKRARAAHLLGDMGSTRAVGPLLAALEDSKREVRAKAARALGRLGAEDEAANLRQALDDRIPFVRATAAIALGTVADRQAGPALLEQARKDQFGPAHAAAYALAAVDPALLWDAARRLGQGPHVAEAADVTAVNRLGWRDERPARHAHGRLDRRVRLLRHPERDVSPLHRDRVA